MSDLYQVLCATEVLKAVWAGLTRPQGQKFNVTAKGGDRSRKFVQWPMLRIFLCYLGACVLGIVNSFLFYSARPLAESSAIALFWSWYNILVLLLACYVCIEQPRAESGESFPTDETVQVTFGKRRLQVKALELSASMVRLSGASPGPIGSKVELRIANIDLRARISRITDREFEGTRPPATTASFA